MMEFHDKSQLWLLALVLVPLVWWPYWRQGRRAVMRFSSIERLKGEGASWRTRLRYILPMLRTAAVILLIVALARPRKGNELTRVHTEGIAIEMVVDRSGSMRALDFVIDGKRRDRLSVVKEVAKDFVLGKGELAGRRDDLVGLVTFARYADAQCPLTIGHGNLLQILDRTEIVTDRNEDGTALGQGLALAVERLQDVDERLKKSSEDQKTAGRGIKSKVVILLTDGRNNAGDVSPDEAAQIAAALGIKVYTIGVGTRGMAPIPATDIFGNRVLQPMRVDIDEETLQSIAKATGGQYFRATDTDSLRKIYEQIDQLEKTRTEVTKYLDYSELASAFTWPAFALLALEVALANTRLRKIP